jgi:pilus assembly protein FimV
MAAPEPESVAPAASKPMDFDLGDISLNLEGVGETKPAAPAAGGKDERWHEVATKLDLAKAYQEMGDAEGAREILEEVLRDGDEQQREAAQGLLDQMSS